MENNPPFYIGQKVVAVVDSKWGYFKKGKIYSVLNIKKCNCGKWTIYIGLSMSGHRQICSTCLTIIGYHGGPAFHGANFFAPIQYSNISKEIAESVKEVSECPDKIIIKEPVYEGKLILQRVRLRLSMTKITSV